MSLRFEKNILKEVYDEEIRHFGISPGANNKIKKRNLNQYINIIL